MSHFSGSVPYHSVWVLLKNFCQRHFKNIMWRHIFQLSMIRRHLLSPSSGFNSTSSKQKIFARSQRLAWLTLQPWRWRHCVPPKYRKHPRGYTVLYPKRYCLDNMLFHSRMKVHSQFNTIIFFNFFIKCIYAHVRFIKNQETKNCVCHNFSRCFFVIRISSYSFICFSEGVTAHDEPWPIYDRLPLVPSCDFRLQFLRSLVFKSSSAYSSGTLWKWPTSI
jgi:hypothetical protein